MARRIIAAIAFAGVALLSIMALAAPSRAGGGSRLVADREFYRAGDAVHLTANVTKLDLDWFGPYTAYLRPLTGDGGSAAGAGAGPHDIAIGRLVVTRLDPTTVRAELTFVLPKLADGQWSILYCSPGCTHRLGDLMGGWLQVGEPAPPPTAPPSTVLPPTTVRPAPVTTTPPPTVAEPATTTAPPTAATASVGTDGGEAGELHWWALGALVIGALAAALAVAARRGRGRRSVTASSTPPGDEGDAVVVELEPTPTSDDEPIGAGR